MKNNTIKNKTGNGNTAQAALADLNAKIAELQQQRVGLAQPLKDRYAELRIELSQTESQIRDLDPEWRPEPVKPRAEARITEILTANEKPMTADEIVASVGELFTPWKVKNTLKKKSTGAKAVFTLADGKYTVRTAT